MGRKSEEDEEKQGKGITLSPDQQSGKLHFFLSRPTTTLKQMVNDSRSCSVADVV